MTPIPTFNILVLGLQFKIQCSMQELTDRLFNTLYTVLPSMQAFLILSVVCPDGY